MLNMIRMELYRMFKTKSMYVIWAIMLVMVVITTVSTKSIIDDPAMLEMYENMDVQNADTSMNIGMSVTVPFEDKDDITLTAMLYGNLQGKFVALMVVIFAVIFSLADVGSGYIKNIAGQVANREKLILAKAIAILVHVLVTMGMFVVGQILCNQVILGYLRVGDGKKLVLYLGTQALLLFALALFCMMIATITRSNLLTMIVSVCICFNVQSLLYGLVDKLVQKAGVEDFQILQYTMTGKMAVLPMDLAGGDAGKAAMVAVVYAVVSLVVGCYVFKKKDI